MKLFNLDSPLMQALSRVADIMLLNVLTFICCIPIVTAGASFTAMHYMCLKMVRNEETYLVRGFFKSFKENFGQATVIWLIQLVVFFILGYDFFIMYTSEEGLNIVLQVLIFIVTILALDLQFCISCSCKVCKYRSENHQKCFVCQHYAAA